MTTTAQRQARVADAAGTWGVWDNHEREWRSTGHGRPGDAWRALLDMHAAYPWELTVTEANAKGEPKLTPDPKVKTCPKCDGDGECWECGATCRECDGHGEVEP